MKGVLFLCTGNSCRSQMAEGFARALAPARVEVHSAGTRPVPVNPRAIEAMAEVGIDISHHRSKEPAALPLEAIDTVITLCGDAAERCPVLPGPVKRLHWPLPDPARARGDPEALRGAFRAVRDEIDARVRELFGAPPPLGGVRARRPRGVTDAGPRGYSA